MDTCIHTYIHVYICKSYMCSILYYVIWWYTHTHYVFREATVGISQEPLGRPFEQPNLWFLPSITERQNYIEDHPSFRLTVAETYLLSYALSLFCLFFLPLLPSQKADAQRRKRDWPYRRHYAIIGCVVLSSAFLYAFVGDVLILDKNLACLRFLGGKGCWGTLQSQFAAWWVDVAGIREFCNPTVLPKFSRWS
jgi:hypothetical protein